MRLQTDYEEMDALTEAVKKEDMPERKRYLAEKAIALYQKGSAVSGLSGKLALIAPDVLPASVSGDGKSAVRDL